jgi:hypothetical protein
MLSAYLSGEATNTKFILFGLTRSGLEPTIYHTQGEHANHYITSVWSFMPNLPMVKVQSLS